MTGPTANQFDDIFPEVGKDEYRNAIFDDEVSIPIICFKLQDKSVKYATRIWASSPSPEGPSVTIQLGNSKVIETIPIAQILLVKVICRPVNWKPGEPVVDRLASK